MSPAQELQVQEKRAVEGNNEATAPTRSYLPATDIYETPEALVVIMEMPGVDKGDIDIAIENDALAVSGRIDLGEVPGPVIGLYRIQHRQLPPQLHALERCRSGKDNGVARQRRVETHVAEGQCCPAAKNRCELMRGIESRSLGLSSTRAGAVRKSGSLRNAPKARSSDCCGRRATTRDHAPQHALC